MRRTRRARTARITAWTTALFRTLVRGRESGTAGLRSVAVLAVVVMTTSAHVGSPDAWYDGPAGPYEVLVHVQAPQVVPGIAVINVKPSGARIEQVTVFVNRFDATGGTPPPDVATPVADSPGWYRTQLWVMTSGSNSVTVTVKGAKGEGTAVVPLTALPLGRRRFDTPLAVLLVAAALVLTLGIVSIAGAAVRESVLPPGAEPDPPRRRRARFAMARALGVIALAVVGTGAWWRAEDRGFTRRLFRAFPVSARVESGRPQPRLVFTITDSVWAHRHDVGWRRARRIDFAGNELIEDHGKLVHLFLISADGRSAFAHLHPVTRDTVTFDAPMPPLPAGRYRVFADIVHASGFTQTMTTTVDVPAGATGGASGHAIDPDDSWATASPGGDPARAMLDDGATLTWLRGGGRLTPDAEAGLRFVVTPLAGDSARLEPYLGMTGHAAVVRSDGRVFIHLHPLGTISVAAQARLANSKPDSATRHFMSAANSHRDTLYFPYAFPQPGSYTVWVQVKRHGRVLTASFPAEVGSATQ